MEQEIKKIGKADKIFYIIFFSLIFISLLVTFVKLFVLKDYQIIAQVSCDPKIENCFVNQCDPSVDPSCSSDSSEQTSYYKLIHKNANNITAVCNEDASGGISCPELMCNTGEDNCSYELCQIGNADGIECSSELEN